ncbi:hypothetical protein [Plantactinospora veratri]
MSTLRSGAERDDGTGARSDAVPGRDGTLTGREDPHLDPTPDPDPAVVDADELLLDALGRGGAVPGGDPLAGALAAWRAELDADLPAFDLDGALALATPHRVGRARTASTRPVPQSPPADPVPVLPRAGHRPNVAPVPVRTPRAQPPGDRARSAHLCAPAGSSAGSSSPVWSASS